LEKKTCLEYQIEITCKLVLAHVGVWVYSAFLVSRLGCAVWAGPIDS
jgi:hypothetical protein